MHYCQYLTVFALLFKHPIMAGISKSSSMATKKPKKTSNRKGQLSYKTPNTKVFLVLFTLLFAAIGSYFVLLSKAATPSLTWAPPTGYTSYPIKNVSVSSTTQTISGGGGDLWVKLPSSPTGPINLTNCHNVVIIGGQINIPAGTGPSVPDVRGIYINGCTGIVHIEGVYINGDIATAEGDGIAIQAPNAIVQIQNVRINKLYGGQDTAVHNHSDIIQPWGGVKELRVDRLTGTSNFQGLQINDDTGHIGKVTVKNTNVGDSGVAPPTSNGGYYFWLKCDTGTTYSFDNVYLQPRSGRTLSNSIYDSNNGSCGFSATSTTASFKNGAVSGTITYGKPASGDFVPAGSVGIGYTTVGVAPTPTTTPVTPTPTPVTPPPTNPTTPTPTTPPPSTPVTPTPTPVTPPVITSPKSPPATPGVPPAPVTGTVTIKQPAVPNAVKTEVYVDNKLKTTVNDTTTASINTAQLSNGNHTVTVKTTDAAGNTTESSTTMDVGNPLMTQVLGQATTKNGKIIIGSLTGVIILGALMAFNVLPIPFLRFG